MRFWAERLKRSTHTHIHTYMYTHTKRRNRERDIYIIERWNRDIYIHTLKEETKREGWEEKKKDGERDTWLEGDDLQFGEDEPGRWNVWSFDEEDSGIVRGLKVFVST